MGLLEDQLGTIRRRCLHSMFECFFDSQKLSIFAVYVLLYTIYIPMCLSVLCVYMRFLKHVPCMYIPLLHLLV